MLSDQTKSCSPPEPVDSLVNALSNPLICLGVVVRNNLQYGRDDGRMTLGPFHYFLVWVRLLWVLYSGTTLCLWRHRSDKGAFLTLADLYFAVSAVRLLIKLFTLRCDSHLLGRLRCRARFCKGFAVLIFLIQACCSFDLTNKKQTLLI